MNTMKSESPKGGSLFIFFFVGVIVVRREPFPPIARISFTFKPLFAIARMPGWCAHRLEELVNANKIIRPAYMPLCPYKEYSKIDDR